MQKIIKYSPILDCFNLPNGILTIPAEKEYVNISYYCRSSSNFTYKCITPQENHLIVNKQ
jgi:hypothetical protein